MSTNPDIVRHAANLVCQSIIEAEAEMQANLTTQDVERVIQLMNRARATLKSERAIEDAAIEEDAVSMTARIDELLSAITSLYMSAEALAEAATVIREHRDNLKIACEGTHDEEL
jgi:hypothetical protein